MLLGSGQFLPTVLKGVSMIQKFFWPTGLGLFYFSIDLQRREMSDPARKGQTGNSPEESCIDSPVLILLHRDTPSHLSLPNRSLGLYIDGPAFVSLCKDISSYSLCISRALDIELIAQSSPLMQGHPHNASFTAHVPSPRWPTAASEIDPSSTHYLY